MTLMKLFLVLCICSWYIEAKHISWRYSNSLNLKQKESCQTKIFNQKITVPGCEEKIIQNNLCYGQCDSSYTPGYMFGILKCSACRPTNPTTIKVSLGCTNGTELEVTVEAFQFCQCMHRSCTQLNHVNKLTPFVENNNNQRISTRKRSKRKKSSRRRRRCRKKRGPRKKRCLKKWRKDKERENNKKNIRTAIRYLKENIL